MQQTPYLNPPPLCGKELQIEMEQRDFVGTCDGHFPSSPAHDRRFTVVFHYNAFRSKAQGRICANGAARMPLGA